MTTAIGGVLIFLMVLLSNFGDLFSHERWPAWLAGSFGWFAAILLIKNVSVVQRLQTGVIFFCGFLLMVAASRRGADIDISAAIGNNAGLISMIASVGFLRLITLSTVDSEEELPVGPQSYYKTLLGVSLFGTVINISAPVIFADRLAIPSGLNRLTAQSITRIFSGCSAWSPFFGGMAAVLTYVPEMQLSFVMMVCFPFAVAGFVAVCIEAKMVYADELETFRGYPVKYSSLWVPAALAAIVIVFSKISPQWSILTCISLGALLLTFLVLIIRHGIAGGLRDCIAHVTQYLPKMVNELFLFLVAGVLASGLAAVISSGLISVPFFEFHALEAAGLLGAMILLAMAGVHPIVMVSGVTPLVLTLAPDANLLAVTYLFAWSLGTCASPLSGTHLVFQGRYGIPGWRGASWNWPYVFIMFMVAIPMLGIVESVG